MEPRDAYRSELSAALTRVEVLARENMELRAGIVRSRIGRALRCTKWLVFLPGVLGLTVVCFLVNAWMSGASCQGPSRPGMTKQIAQELRKAAQLYVAMYPGTCPTVADLLREKLLPREPLHLLDPWDTAFDIGCTSDDVVVVSAGPDRRWDTPDDIRVPAPEFK